MLTAQQNREILKRDRAIRELLQIVTRPDEFSPMTRSVAITSACSVLGHVAKHSRPEREDYEKGCFCGHRDWV